MKLLRGLGGVVLGILTALLGTVLGILAAVLWLVGALLCVTVILIPLGIPVVRLANRLFGIARKLMHLPDPAARRRTSTCPIAVMACGPGIAPHGANFQAVEVRVCGADGTCRVLGDAVCCGGECEVSLRCVSPATVSVSGEVQEPYVAASVDGCASIWAARMPPPFQLLYSVSAYSANRATASTRSSECRGPTIWSPTGSPAAVVPAGMLIAGCCERLNG